MWKKFKITKSQFILAVTISLISLKAYLGGLAGYFFAKFFTNKIDSLIINFGNYKLHLHHWLMGSVALGLTVLYEIAPLMNYLFLGFLGGLIFQGIFSYPDWYKILIRKK